MFWSEIKSSQCTVVVELRIKVTKLFEIYYFPGPGEKVL